MAKRKKLAICGGSPAFKEKLYVGRPNICDRRSLEKKIGAILKNKWLTNDGPFLREFEAKIAGFVGVKHCIAVCNATIGLEILARALSLSGEVILPSMTFVAGPNALLWQGITPVFADIDRETWNIDPKNIEKLITRRTTAIMGVHLFGRPCEMESLQKISKKHNLALFFDSAHAFGCSYKGKMIGNFGRAEVFSFHATKFLNSLEGGAVVTNDSTLAEKLRLMRNFGFSGHDQTESIGINGKMNEVSAAFGLTSLEKINEIIDINRDNYHHYVKNLIGIPGLKIIEFDAREKSNYQYVVLEIDQDLTNLSRDLLVKILWSENVIARRYFHPGCHRLEPYLSLFPKAGKHLPVTELLADRLIALPTGSSMTEGRIIKLCKLIKHSILHGSELSRLLESGKTKDITGALDIIKPKLV